MRLSVLLLALATPGFVSAAVPDAGVPKAAESGKQSASPALRLFGPAATMPKWLEPIQAALLTGRFNDSRLLIDAQLKQQHNDRDLATLYYLRSYADVGLKDVPSLRTDAGAALKHADDRLALDIAYFQFGLYLDADLALSSFEHIAVEAPDFARTIKENVFWNLAQFFHQRNRTAEYNRLVIALADVGFGVTRTSDEIQTKAAEILLERGQVDKALDHARQVAGRDGLIDLLTDRRFEKLWPELESTSGDHLAKAARTQLSLAQVDFKATPKSLPLRLNLMRAYESNGNLVEAEKLGAGVGKTLDELMSLDEETSYVIDTHANILGMLGRPDDADKRRAELVQTWTPDRRWMINIAINRLIDLYSDGRYKDVLAELDRPGNRYELDSSAYAKQILRGLRIGSLIGLKRKAEAKAIIPDLIAHQDDSPAATIDALLFANQDADAEKVALAALADPEKRGAVIQSLRITDPASKSGDAQADQLHKRLRARPAVAAAFNTYARDLPERLRLKFDVTPSPKASEPQPVRRDAHRPTRSGE